MALPLLPTARTALD